MENKRFILKSGYEWWGVLDTTGEIKGEFRDCFTTDEVVDLLNKLNEKNIRLSKDKQLAENALVEYKQKVKDELELRYSLSNHKPVYQFMAEKLNIHLEGVYE